MIDQCSVRSSIVSAKARVGYHKVSGRSAIIGTQASR